MEIWHFLSKELGLNINTIIGLAVLLIILNRMGVVKFKKIAGDDTDQRTEVNVINPSAPGGFCQTHAAIESRVQKAEGEVKEMWGHTTELHQIATRNETNILNMDKKIDQQGEKLDDISSTVSKNTGRLDLLINMNKK